MRSRLALVFVAMLATATVANGASQVYRVEVRTELNGLDIKVEHVAQSTMLVMRLTNDSDVRARCTLNYDASPQTPRRSTVFVNPGRTVQNTLRAQRRWFTVTVDVECRPANAADAAAAATTQEPVDASPPAPEPEPKP
jgi:hypothetical protein